MRVLVTGGTGFVGGHTVAALVGAGHHVRLLVRRPQQVPVTLDPLGAEVTDVVVGDVLDDASVAAALEGMDAVVHAAAVYTSDPRRREDVARTNVGATRIVLGRAVARGLDPVVHVSSTAALVRRGGSGPDLPLGDMTTTYARSKVESEVVARDLQGKGHPVVCVYPGGVLGPHDPYHGDQGELIRWLLRGVFPVWPRGGLHYVDVRDVAAVVLALLEPGRGPRRYVVPGHHLTGTQLYGTLSRVAGRRLPHVELPGRLLAPPLRALDEVVARLPARLRYPAESEGVEMIARDTRMDDRPGRVELGIEPLPLEDSLRDTARWLVGSGRLRPARAPALG
ncbi:NAD-dependent epimerase/dehydratase family protein [uncultured Ornithinimicrobium sp.]|uniref:NAD-dependent epimerase/dehydratase family protein n=1 Tax=uncultured Ornithinimicrobium sp. TaxID=259307 RepID=UPI002591E995|nr:NAD-dependent epimerase/dehydratase family protein [uncultured Ornithinimicrobium sp.]